MEDEKIKIVIKSIIDENDYIDNNKKQYFNEIIFEII